MQQMKYNQTHSMYTLLYASGGTDGKEYKEDIGWLHTAIPMQLQSSLHLFFTDIYAIGYSVLGMVFLKR